jgi:hypothetical protein
MSIDRNTRGTSPPEWCVYVCVSVLEHVPRDVLAAWMAVESFADASGECWPDNATLAKRMCVGSVRAAQRATLKLVEYGILKRHDQGGNRRSLTLLRRTSKPISSAEWASLQERGEARQEQRTDPEGVTWMSCPIPDS